MTSPTADRNLEGYRVVRHSRSATSIAHTTANRVNFPGTTQHRSSR